MKMQHILVPTDFSERSEKAIKAAGLLVDFFGCTVDLIHAVPLMKYFSESMDPLGVPFSLEKHLYPHSMDIAKKKLEELAEKYIKKEYRGSNITLVERKPSEAIYNKANSEHYDLILMSARGEHDSIHLMGGTTEKVIRHSHVPVFTINEDMNLDDIKNIVVPLDFSDYSYFSIIPAFELAKELGAKITILNVIELYSAGSDMIPYVPNSIEIDPVYESMIAKLSEYLLNHEQYDLNIQRTGVVFEDKLIHFKDGNSYTVEMESKILKGITAHQEIVDYVNDEGDMVVMSTHGRTGLSRVFIGSTTEQVSRHVEKPLFTIRPQFYEIGV
jgi:nucleotide-binding universal stress UspA family protein